MKNSYSLLLYLCCTTMQHDCIPKICPHLRLKGKYYLFFEIIACYYTFGVHLIFM